MTAVVLGPGGPVGTAWLAGLAAGLRREGVDLGAADLIVGTSAGAIVGAILATGGDLDRLAEIPAQSADLAQPGQPAHLAQSAHPAQPGQPGHSELATPASNVRADPDRLAEVFAILGDPKLDRGEAIRRVGRIATIASTGDPEALLARVRLLVGHADWPDRPLLIPSVSAETGEAVVWDRYGAASLTEAIAASIAFPATAPPITIAGQPYIDGALRAGINLDLADAHDTVIVAEPMAHMDGVRSGDDRGLRLCPDTEAIEALGPDVGDRTRWSPAFRAGVRQAPDAAERIREYSPQRVVRGDGITPA